MAGYVSHRMFDLEDSASAIATTRVVQVGSMDESNKNSNKTGNEQETVSSFAAAGSTEDARSLPQSITVWTMKNTTEGEDENPLEESCSITLDSTMEAIMGQSLQGGEKDKGSITSLRKKGLLRKGGGCVGIKFPKTKWRASTDNNNNKLQKKKTFDHNKNNNNKDDLKNKNKKKLVLPDNPTEAIPEDEESLLQPPPSPAHHKTSNNNQLQKRSLTTSQTTLPNKNTKISTMAKRALITKCASLQNIVRSNVKHISSSSQSSLKTSVKKKNRKMITENASFDTSPSSVKSRKRSNDWKAVPDEEDDEEATSSITNPNNYSETSPYLFPYRDEDDEDSDDDNEDEEISPHLTKNDPTFTTTSTTCHKNDSYVSSFSDDEEYNHDKHHHHVHSFMDAIWPQQHHHQQHFFAHQDNSTNKSINRQRRRQHHNIVDQQQYQPSNSPTTTNKLKMHPTFSTSTASSSSPTSATSASSRSSSSYTSTSLFPDSTMNSNTPTSSSSLSTNARFETSSLSAFFINPTTQEDDDNNIFWANCAMLAATAVVNSKVPNAGPLAKIATRTVLSHCIQTKQQLQEQQMQSDIVSWKKTKLREVASKTSLAIINFTRNNSNTDTTTCSEEVLSCASDAAVAILTQESSFLNLGKSDFSCGQDYNYNVDWKDCHHHQDHFHEKNNEDTINLTLPPKIARKIQNFQPTTATHSSDQEVPQEYPFPSFDNNSPLGATSPETSSLSSSFTSSPIQQNNDPQKSEKEEEEDNKHNDHELFAKFEELDLRWSLSQQQQQQVKYDRPTDPIAIQLEQEDPQEG